MVSGKLAQPIEKLGFSMRTFNALVNNEINLVADLVKLSQADLAHLKGFGEKAQAEVNAKLAELEV
jgi:DNA-directed RNA polymerase alpha subunit